MEHPKFLKLKKNIAGARLQSQQIPFIDEYYQLHKPHACRVALQWENRAKNYYPNLTLPFDDHLIQSTSKYINASPMHVAGKYYIAAQGPKQNTFSTFWEMVWQENVSLILTLTDPVEYYKGVCHVKFEPYWPQAYEERAFQDVVVKTLSEQPYAEWPELPEMLYENRYVLRKGALEREVVHLRIVGWPDGGVISPLSLLHLQQACATISRQPGGVLVHCAGGIGRTGVFIAFDSLLEDLADGAGDLCPLKRVLELRDLRYGVVVAVQEQFHLLLDALDLFIKSNNNENFNL